MSVRTHRLLLACCLLGLGASAAAAYVHYRLIADPTYSSFCDVSATWSCGAVYESRYGDVAGVPVAVGGVIWFVLATLLTVAARPGTPPAETPRPRKKGTPAAPAVSTFADAVPGYLFALSVVGLAVVLYLAYASFFVLGLVCILCLLTYVGVIGIFILSGRSAEGLMTSLPRRLGRDLRALASRPAALTVALLFVAFAASAIAFFPRQTDLEERAAAAASSALAAPVRLDESQQSEFERFYTALPRVPVAVPTDGAKVLIVKFNDYQCPPCKMTYLEYKPVIKKYQDQYPGQIKYVTLDYPLDPECNTGGGGHMAACEAAVAVRLARAHGRADQMEQWLFDNQAQLTPDLVRQGARSVGQVTDFDAQYAKTLELVKGDIQLGTSLQVRGTPTFFINGVRIPIVKAEYLDAAIAYELKR